MKKYILTFIFLAGVMWRQNLLCSNLSALKYDDSYSYECRACTGFYFLHPNVFMGNVSFYLHGIIYKWSSL